MATESNEAAKAPTPDKEIPKPTSPNQEQLTCEGSVQDSGTDLEVLQQSGEAAKDTGKARDTPAADEERASPAIDPKLEYDPLEYDPDAPDTTTKYPKMICGEITGNLYTKKDWFDLKAKFNQKAKKTMPSDVDFEDLMDFATTNTSNKSVAQLLQKIKGETRIAHAIEVKGEFEDEPKFLNLLRPTNVCAVLVQMFGDEAEEECTHCQGKHGIFEAGDDRDSRCVFLPGAYNGTYGCCLYSSGATRCTIRADKKEEEAEAGPSTPTKTGNKRKADGPVESYQRGELRKKMNKSKSGQESLEILEGV